LARCLTANSSSPHTSAKEVDDLGVDLEAEEGICLFGLAAVLVNPIKDFTHVFDLLEECVGHIDRTFLSGGKRQAIAGAGINFNNLSGELILLLQNQSGEISRVLQLRNYDSLDSNAEAFENTLNEIVRQRPFFGRIAQKHSDDRAHVRLDVDDKHFVIIANEQSTPAIGGKNPANLHGHDIVLHIHSLLCKFEKTSLP
jgi:hypothetical protein